MSVIKREYDLKSTVYYYRKYKKLVKFNFQLKKIVNQILTRLVNDPFDNSLRTHQVKSRHFGITFSSQVTSDIRIIWKLENNEITILLLDIGGHDDLYT